MDNKRKINLTYSEEFRIACKISNLTPEELLQYFIDHVSFYAFIGGSMDQSYVWSTAVCIEYKEFWGQDVAPVSDIKMQELSLKYIKKLTALSLELNLSSSLETVKSVELMKEWSLEMLPLTDYQSTLQTELGEVFSLSFDFNLLCRMNGIDIMLLLQYFIDHISLAKERALNLHKTTKIDPSTAVLLILMSVSDEAGEQVLPQQNIYKQFGLRLLKLDKKQSKEYVLENRIFSYSEFYREWYYALNKIVN